MSDKLKPCPFCGSEAEIYSNCLCGIIIYMVMCSVETCQCQEMGWHDTEQKAIDVWNSRPVEDALQSRIAEMEKRAFSIYELFGKHDSGDSAEYYLDNLDIDIRELLCKSERQQSRITELEKSAVVWHRYPDEKPEKPSEFDGMWMNILVNDIYGTTWIGTCRFIGKTLDVLAPQTTKYWAYLPTPPEGGEMKDATQQRLEESIAGMSPEEKTLFLERIKDICSKLSGVKATPTVDNAEPKTTFASLIRQAKVCGGKPEGER